MFYAFGSFFANHINNCREQLPNSGKPLPTQRSTARNGLCACVRHNMRNGCQTAASRYQSNGRPLAMTCVRVCVTTCATAAEQRQAATNPAVDLCACVRLNDFCACVCVAATLHHRSHFCLSCIELKSWQATQPARSRLAFRSSFERPCK